MSDKKKNDVGMAGGCGLILLLVLVIGAVQGIGNCVGQTRDNLLGKPAATASPSPTATPVPTRTSLIRGNRAPAVGKQGRIHVETDFIAGATTQDNYDAYLKAVSANDRIGVFNLLAQGRIYSIDNGTKVLVLDRGGFLGSLVQIRVLDGPELGSALWVAVEFVDGP